MSAKRKSAHTTLDDRYEQEQKKIKTNMSAAATARRKDTAQPVKKLVIKNLKAAPKLPENFEEQTWKILEGAVRAVCHSQPTDRSLEELYKAAEDLCYQKLASNLYVRLQRECEDHVKQEYQKLSTTQTSGGNEYLNLIDDCWSSFCQHMTLIRKIFLHLDRTYVIQNASIKSIWDMGLQIFRTQIASIPEVEKKLVSGIIQLVQEERNGQVVDRILIKNLCRMLVSLGMYSECLEKQLLAATVDFYHAEGIEKSRDMEVSEYLKHVESRLNGENERVTHYLDNSTRRFLVSVVEKQMLEDHINTITAGTEQLLANDRREDLARAYSLMSRVGGLPALKSAFSTYVRTTGAAMVEDVEKESTFVDDLLTFRAKLDVILTESFIKNQEFDYALKEAFEHFINQKVNRPAELIAKFVDAKLRSGNKSASEDEMEHLLDRVMVLFRYIHGKDVFEAFYKKDLAKRLLLDKSASMDLEKTMISKLKTECGSAFTNKLEGMFKDVDLSSDIMNSFSDSKFHDELSGEMDMNVQVLTAGYWPAYAPVELNLPKNMVEYQETFKRFYLSKYSGRRLTWQNSLGQCTLKAAFPLGTKELLVTLLQTSVLLLFNDADQLTAKDIQQLSGLQGQDLKRTLLSLACGKIRVLNKEPSSKEVSEADTFVVNKTFKQKLHRIKINSVQIKETPEERQKTTETVMQDRQYQIDAAIVRIMKTRKQLSHSALIAELFSQLKFPAQPGDLKKRIESLIEREYMERSGEDSQIYIYMA